MAGGLVDRIHLFVSPQIMGSDAVPAFRGMTHAIHMAEVEVERYENDLGLCSLLKDPWTEDRDQGSRTLSALTLSADSIRDDSR
jgi:diaminohydroxyphosphoribosylaminopyrimidine deaminase/5-amino-6-(5-phosphoribosylamino)uracil reductase